MVLVADAVAAGCGDPVIIDWSMVADGSVRSSNASNARRIVDDDRERRAVRAKNSSSRMKTPSLVVGKGSMRIQAARSGLECRRGGQSPLFPISGGTTSLPNTETARRKINPNG